MLDRINQLTVLNIKCLVWLTKMVLANYNSLNNHNQKLSAIKQCEILNLKAFWNSSQLNDSIEMNTDSKLFKYKNSYKTF